MAYHTLTSGPIALSKFVLGRKACRKEFHAGRPFTVSAYTFGKDIYYTDPVSRDSKASSRVLYRIKVYPKRAVGKPE